MRKRRFLNRKSKSPDASATSPESSPVSPEQDKARIEELEAQVKELSGMVEILVDSTKDSDKKKEAHQAKKNPNQLEIHTALDPHALVDGVRVGVGKILGVQKGETIETRIGSTWLPRIAVILFMTVLILGMRDDTIKPFYKILIGYGIGALLSGYGVYRRQLMGLFPKAMLGIGLSTVYYATYSLFYLPEIELVESMEWALPVTSLALLFIAWALWLGKSQFAIIIVLLLTQFTILNLLATELRNETVNYSLITWTLMAFSTAFLQLRGRWKYALWLALLCAYGGYMYTFTYLPDYLGVVFRGEFIQSETYIAVSYVFLSALYLLFAFGSMACARNHPNSTSGMVLFGLFNVMAYVYTSQYAFRSIPDQVELTFALMGVACLIMSVLARSFFAPNNVIMQTLLAQAILWIALYLHFALSIVWEPISLGVVCFILAVVYKRIPLSVITALQFFLMIAAFMGAMGMVQITGDTLIGGFPYPTKWVFTFSLVVVFTMIAWYYDNRVAPYATTLSPPEGTWILANRRWKWSPNVIAVIYTTVAAFILSALTIYDMGSDPRLPFILAGEALVFALLGVILRTPQMELSGTLILVTAHVTFHFFGYMNVSDFTTQSYFIEASIALALVSYLGSYFWERYIRHIEDGTDWEHDLLSAIPFVASTLVLTSVFEYIINSPLASLSLTLLGLTLMSVGMLTRLIGLRIAALTAVGLGAVSFYIRSLDVLAPNKDYDYYLWVVLGVVLSIAGTERILHHWESKVEKTSRVTPGFHAALVLISITYGTLGLWHGARADELSIYMMGWALGVLAFGIIFRSAYYRFAALFLILAVFVRLYIHDLSNLAPLLKILVFALFTGIIFLISWGYSRYRAK